MICPRCGLPEELCVCEDMARAGQKIRVRSDRRKYGKTVTLVDGLDKDSLHKVAKEMKRRLACGGTAKGDHIELQGDHMSRVREVLIGMGFSEDMVDVS